MTRVLHTGDTHLGYRQYHSPERQRDFLRAFEQVIDDAIDEDIDAVVHAGDLFHDRRPRLRDIMGALSVLRRLDGAAIPFLAIVGNHEGKRDAQWLDLFESLGLATRLDATPTVIGRTAFYGLDFVPRARRDTLEYDFEPTDATSAALVSHGLFQPFEHGDWDAREILETAPVDFDAMLLGDDHTPGRREVEGTWLTYCGSTERASADEREARGYNLVTFEDGVDIRRRSIDTREFVFVDVELADGEGVDRVRERVGQHDLEAAVVIVSVTGEGDRVAPATIEEFAREQGALIARVTDHREIETDAVPAVRFADPEAAVRERIQHLGLSSAARDLDETIRASKVADSNVADTVESRVRDIIADADDGYFEPAPQQAEDESAEGAIHEETEGSETPTEDSGETGTTGSLEKTEIERDTEVTETESEGEETGTESDVQESGRASDAEESDTEGTVAEPEGGSDGAEIEPERSPDESGTGTGDDDSQATMEEYL